MEAEEYTKRKKYRAVIDLLDKNFTKVYRALDELFDVSRLEHQDIVCARCGAIVMRQIWANQASDLRMSRLNPIYCSSKCRLRFGGERLELEPKSEYERILKKHGTYGRYEKHLKLEKQNRSLI